MTFEEWWCDESLSDEDNRHIGYEYAKEAWDEQQQRIVELVKLVETMYDDGYANGYTDGKQDAQEQE